MTTSILRGPGDLLAMIPSMLGFVPVESLVLLGVRANGELAVALRVDREDCLIDDVVAPMARAVSAHLSRDGTDFVVIVSYTHCNVRLACDAADAMRTAIGGTFRRMEVWAVQSGRFFAPGCADAGCCPGTGRALPVQNMTDPHLSSAKWLASGLHTKQTPAWGSAPATARRRSARAADRWLLKRDAGPEHWRNRSFEAWNDAVDRTWTEASAATDAGLGKVIAALGDVRARDAIIVSLVPGSRGAVQDVLDGNDSGTVARVLDSIFDPRQGTRVDPELAEVATGVLSRCAARARKKEAAPPLAILALVQWWAGDSEAALALCEQALQAERGYRLAGLVQATVAAGLEPGWCAD